MLRPLVGGHHHSGAVTAVPVSKLKQIHVEADSDVQVRRSFITTTVREQRPRSHHKGATNRVRTGDDGIRFYAIVNLGNASPDGTNFRVRVGPRKGRRRFYVVFEKRACP